MRGRKLSLNPAGAKASFASGVTSAGPVAAVHVTLAYDTVQIGDTIRWTAEAVDANGQAVTSGVTYHWGNPGSDLFGYVAKSGNTAKAVARIVGRDTAVMTVSASGAKFRGYGYVLIVAAGTKPPGDSTPTAPVASVSVTLNPASLAVGQTSQATATAMDSAGQPITGASTTWKSSDTTVAVVDAKGLVHAAKVGKAKIQAQAGSESDSATVTVTSSTATVASVSVTLNSPSLTVGQNTQATATARDSAGQLISGRAVTWSSNKTSVATVSNSGLVNGLAAGSATISAAIDGITGSAVITVTALTPPPSTGDTGDAVVLAPGQDIQAAVSAQPAPGRRSG